MKSLYTLTFSLAVLGGITGVSAQNAATERGAEYMRRLSSSMESMRAYTVDFRAEAEGESIRGRYEVAADRYHIAVAGNEVYGDDRIRREIDARKREIVVDAADTTSRNLLTNPTRGFRLLGEGYTPHLDSETDGRAVVTLTPTTPNSSTTTPASPVGGTITVTLSTADSRPERIRYDTDGESVTIVIERISSGAEIPSFDSSRYPDYEIIDFR